MEGKKENLGLLWVIAIVILMLSNGNLFATTLPPGNNVAVIYLYKDNSPKSLWPAETLTAFSNVAGRINQLTGKQTNFILHNNAYKISYQYPSNIDVGSAQIQHDLLKEISGNPTLKQIYENPDYDGLIIVLEDTYGAAFAVDYKSPIIFNSRDILDSLLANIDILITHETMHIYGLGDYCSSCPLGIPSGCEHDIMADVYTPNNYLCQQSLNDLRTIIIKDTLPSVQCIPNWQCTSWSTCTSGTQTRTCTDSNYCDTASGKPAISQSCTVTCTNECEYNGEKMCSGSVSYQVCGNYDSDSCLEWSSGYYCSSNYICQNGQCVSNEQKECYSDSDCRGMAKVVCVDGTYWYHGYHCYNDKCSISTNTPPDSCLGINQQIPESKDNTLLYVVIGFGIFILLMITKR